MTDTLYIEHADQEDAKIIASANAYDYNAQQWIKADHAHMEGATSEAIDTCELLFCGADRATCERAPAQRGGLFT